MAKYYITVNPQGGMKKGMDILEQIIPIFESARANITVLETEYAGHARDLARDTDMSDYDLSLIHI